MVKEPTRYNYILDLFLTTNPTLIKSVACLPGLNDHAMVIAECALKPTPLKQKPSKAQLHVFRKADWPRLKSLLSDYKDKFITNNHGKSVDDLWTEFTSALERFSSECIPTKMVRGKSSLPWITQEIKRLIRKRDRLYRNF